MAYSLLLRSRVNVTSSERLAPLPITELCPTFSSTAFTSSAAAVAVCNHLVYLFVPPQKLEIP